MPLCSGTGLSSQPVMVPALLKSWVACAERAKRAGRSGRYILPFENSVRTMNSLQKLLFRELGFMLE